MRAEKHEPLTSLTLEACVRRERKALMDIVQKVPRPARDILATLPVRPRDAVISASAIGFHFLPAFHVLKRKVLKLEYAPIFPCSSLPKDAKNWKTDWKTWYLGNFKKKDKEFIFQGHDQEKANVKSQGGVLPGVYQISLFFHLNNEVTGAVALNILICRLHIRTSSLSLILV